MSIIYWGRPNTASFIYNRYKDSPFFTLGLLALSFVVCLFLVVNIMIPQIQNWFSIKQEVEAIQARSAIIKANIHFMSGMDKQALETNRELAIYALPPEKDFGYIIDAIAAAAANSGVLVNDFSFNPGMISSVLAETSKEDVSNRRPVTSVMLSLGGNLKGIKSFVGEIARKLPVNEIETVETEKGTANVTLSFYNKPYVPLRIVEDQPINPLSLENSVLFKDLAQWGASNSAIQESGQAASSSGVPLF